MAKHNIDFVSPKVTYEALEQDVDRKFKALVDEIKAWEKEAYKDEPTFDPETDSILQNMYKEWSCNYIDSNSLTSISILPTSGLFSDCELVSSIDGHIVKGAIIPLDTKIQILEDLQEEFNNLKDF